MIQTLKTLLGTKRSLPYEYVENWFLKRCKGEVMTGPFSGMLCIETHVGCKPVPRLLGIYEKELQPLMATLLQEDFDAFLDVGAAEGYYAVGFARSSRVPKVIAFETEEAGQRALRKAADANNVGGRVTVRGFCSSSELAKELAIAEKPLLLVDIEGAEEELLDPTVVPELRNCTIVVELHEVYREGIGKLLRGRFEESHRISELFSAPRCLEDIPIETPWLVRTLLGKWTQMLIEERGDIPMSWLHMVPRGAQPALGSL